VKDKIRERNDAGVPTSLRFSLSMGSSLKIVCRAVRSSIISYVTDVFILEYLY